MYDHIGLKAKSLSTSKHFYKAALAPLGLVPDEVRHGIGPKGAPALWLGEGAPSKNVHIAFTAENHAAVEEYRMRSEGGRARQWSAGAASRLWSEILRRVSPRSLSNNIEAVCAK